MRRVPWLLATSFVFSATTPGLAAVQQDLAPAHQEFTGPSLARNHWAIEAVRRAEVLGLIAEHLPAQRSYPLEVVVRGLEEAARTSLSESPQLSEMTQEWLERIREEFQGIAGARGVAYRLGARADLGISARRGAAAPGTGEFEPDRTGASPLSDRTDESGTLSVSIGLGEAFGLSAYGGWNGERVDLTTAELTGSWGRVRTSIGRVPVGYGHGFGGGVALTGEAPLDAVQIYTRQPFRLPSVLAALGNVSLHGFVGRMWEDRHPDDPYIWGASGQLQPHRRLTLGVHRVALFGGDEPITLGRIGEMLVGRVAGIGFEDQVVSVSGRALLPTEAVLPLEIYLEWGAEDGAGAWFDVPGRVAGAWIPAVPFAPMLGLGGEYAHFTTSCCGNPSWYRHWSFEGAWASKDMTLGHPLGGDGREAIVHASLDLSRVRALLRARGFYRSRRDENLYSPGRTGRSRGVAAVLEWAPISDVRLQVDGSREVGSGWAETKVLIQGGMLF